VALLAAECPVGEDDREWIDNTLRWLRENLGAEGLTGPVIVPTDEFFPGPYAGTRAEQRALVQRIAGWMRVDSARIVVGSANRYDDRKIRQRIPPGVEELHGHYRTASGRIFIDLDGLPAAPVQLVTAIAHELAHDRLPPDGGPPTIDDEETVDLVLVYLGLGVFAANAALDYEKHAEGRRISFRVSRGGLLTEQMHGYALARYARMRHESSPAWAVHLDLNPRTYLRRALRYLDRVEGVSL
jgi:hypothetical protein